MDEVIKSTKTSKGLVRLYDSGIMHQIYDKGTELEYQDTLDEFEIYKDGYCHEQARPILVELDNLKKVSKESRGIYSSNKTVEYFSGAALLVGNPVSRIIGNFYLGINKTSMPVRMFTKRNEALAWLDSLENPDWDIVYEAPFGEISAGDMFVSWVTHDLMHLRQLVELQRFYLAEQAKPYRLDYAGDW